jgi:hypothetical protein
MGYALRLLVSLSARDGIDELPRPKRHCESQIGVDGGRQEICVAMPPLPEGLFHPTGFRSPGFDTHLMATTGS